MRLTQKHTHTRPNQSQRNCVNVAQIRPTDVIRLILLLVFFSFRSFVPCLDSSRLNFYEWSESKRRRSKRCVSKITFAKCFRASAARTQATGIPFGLHRISLAGIDIGHFEIASCEPAFSVPKSTVRTLTHTHTNPQHTMRELDCD